MHDPRLGRFFAIDPLAPKYPHNSPYAFSENMVIHMIELEGLESTPTKVEGIENTPYTQTVKNQYLNSSGNAPITPVNLTTTSPGPTGGTGYTPTVDPYAGAKIEPYTMLPYDGSTAGNAGTLYMNSLGGRTLNFCIQCWNEGVDLFSGNASWSATADGFKGMGTGIANSFTTYDHSAWSRWETYELPFAVVTTGGITSLSRMSFGNFSKFTPKTSAPLYHYTNEAGYNAIMKSKVLNPSIGVKNARFGSGQYFTDIAPGTFTKGQTSYRLYGVPWNGSRLTHYVKIETSGLNIINNKPFNFLNPSSAPLNLNGRILGGGATGL